MHVRSHKFINTHKYIDTTYYDEKENCLDIGYQMLIRIDLKLYPKISNISKLLVDYNNITVLPPSSLLPHLQELSCSSNKLSSIPYYPKLYFLNVSKNFLTNLIYYDMSNLDYLDVSFNKDFDLNITLPYCKKLFITDCNLKSFNIKILPQLQYLDIENNKLDFLNSHNCLLELNIKNNVFSELSEYPSLEILFADYNKIQTLNTFTNLKKVTISNNNLVSIDHQPNINSLIADHNKITKIGNFPHIKTIDLSYNKITQFEISNNIVQCYLHFNEMTLLKIPNLNLALLAELQISFNNYKKIYESIVNYIKYIEFSNNLIEVEKNIKKYNLEYFTSYILTSFRKIKFVNRSIQLRKITKNISRNIKSNTFDNLLEKISAIYYSTLFVNIYFK